MSKHSMGWAVVAVAAVFMVAFSFSGLTRHANGDQVLPGGHAAKIRSYSAVTSPYEPVTIIPSVEGDHGTILTDLSMGKSSNGNLPVWAVLTYNDGTGWKALCPFPSTKTSYQSGIPIPAGAAVRVECSVYPDGGVGIVTVSGYVW